MKAIINGKLYDTENAKEIASWTNGRGFTDFHYVEEVLYRTKKGAWFLHCEGGAASVYAQQSNGYSGSGSAIEVFTPSEALDWLAKNGFTDEAMKYFGDEIEHG